MKFKEDTKVSLPVETEYGIWIEEEGNGLLQLSYIMEICKKKWPEVKFEDLYIAPYNHHQYCINYDLYDSGDYVNYLYISTKPIEY